MKKAFTVLEIVVVIAIIATLVAIIIPILGAARRDGHRVNAISNLRQCGLSLVLYHSDNDENYPSPETARVLLGSKITCDPEDNWRKSCEEQWPDPMVGSFGYIMGLSGFKGPNGSRGWTIPNRCLLATVFYGNPVPKPFKGEHARPDGGLNLLPQAGVIRLYEDLSVATIKHWYLPDAGNYYVNWPDIILDSADQEYIPLKKEQ